MKLANKLIYLLLMLVASPISVAHKYHQQPFRVSADQADLNYDRGINTYYGHVRAWHGEDFITATKMIVISNQRKQLTKLIATGKFAHYHTKPRDQAAPVDGEAETIIYDESKNTVTLLGNAKAQQASNLFHGPHLEYHIKKRTIDSVGNAIEHINILLDQ